VDLRHSKTYSGTLQAVDLPSFAPLEMVMYAHD
jgi:hypothetical protein